MWRSKLAKITIPPLSSLYPILYPSTEWTNWSIHEVYISMLIRWLFFLCQYIHVYHIGIYYLFGSVLQPIMYIFGIGVFVYHHWGCIPIIKHYPIPVLSPVILLGGICRGGGVELEIRGQPRDQTVCTRHYLCGSCCGFYSVNRLLHRER